MNFNKPKYGYKRYRLFHKIYGFKCTVLYVELAFLFGVPGTIEDTDTINNYIESTGYYLRDL